MDKEKFTTTNQNDVEGPDGIIISGKTLRRRYIYQQRDIYIMNKRVAPSEEVMEEFAEKARNIYVEEGNYSLSKTTGEATWLGKF